MKTLTRTRKFRLVTFFFLVLWSAGWPGIDLRAQLDPLKEANLYFDQGLYHQALIYLSQIEGLETKAPLLFKRGVCHYETNDLDRALVDFRRAWELGYQNRKTDLYLGKIRLHEGAFEEAAEYLKKYLAVLDINDPERMGIRKLIKQCGNALKISYQRPLAIIENPSAINSIHNDFGLLESPFIKDRFYFNSDRPLSVTSYVSGSSDIFAADRSEGQWMNLSPISAPVRSDRSEIILDFTPDGQGLYFFRSGSTGGLFRSVFINGKDSLEKIDLPVQIHVANADVYVANSAVVIFADKELEGFGGYDLFYSIYDGEQWGVPVNFGDVVNSHFDEVSPFLSSNGQELYFSSNRPYSIGGFDVFRTRFMYEANVWSAPENLGIPINSPGDERYFRLSADGLKAYFASNRKNSKGGYDTYIGRFKEPQKGQEFHADHLAFANYSEETSTNLDSFNVNLNHSVVSSKESPKPPEKGISEEVKTETMPFLYYTSGQDVLSPQNKELLSRVSVLMQQYANTFLEIVTYTNKDGILEYNLYSSIKVGEKVEQYMMELGTDDQRITVKGFGENYPLIRTGTDQDGESLAQRLNKRVELRLHTHEGYSPVKIEHSRPDVHPAYFDSDYELYQALVDDVVSYKIQIALVNQMYRGVVLDLFNDAIVEEHAATGLYAYLVGLYDSYAKALDIRRSLEKEGMTDVRIVPYINGMRIDTEHLSYYVNAYPDLRNFMNYEN